MLVHGASWRTHHQAVARSTANHPCAGGRADRRPPYGAAIGSREPRGIAWWRRPLAWQTPTNVEIGLIGRASLAAGLSWWIADVTAADTTPLVAVFTAVVVIQVSTRATLRMAVARTLAVVVGACLGLALGEAVTLRGLSVAVAVGISLFVADFALRLPLAAARQVPMSMVVVLAATTYDEPGSVWTLAAQTAMGAAIGAAVVLLLPVSRVADRRRALSARARRLAEVWSLVGAGLAGGWSADEATRWRRLARAATDDGGAMSDPRLAREASSWSYRRRRDDAELDALEVWARWLDAAAATAVSLTDDLEAEAARAHAAPKEWPAAAAIMASLAAGIAATANRAAGPSVLGAADDELRRAAAEARRSLGGGQSSPSPPVVDERTVVADVARLVTRLQEVRVTPAASPSPR